MSEHEVMMRDIRASIFVMLTEADVGGEPVSFQQFLDMFQSSGLPAPTEAVLEAVHQLLATDVIRRNDAGYEDLGGEWYEFGDNFSNFESLYP